MVNRRKPGSKQNLFLVYTQKQSNRNPKASLQICLGTLGNFSSISAYKHQ